MFNQITDNDFKIVSNDKSSHITFTLLEYMHQQLPSISCSIEIVDGKFAGCRTNVWFSLSDMYSFIDALEQLEQTRQGKVSLCALTNEDFNISFESCNKKGNIVCLYSISKSKFYSEVRILNNLNGGFQVDSEYFLKVLSDFKNFTSVSELKSNIDFY